MKLIVNFDGGSRGNPGPAAIGVVIADDKGVPIRKLGRYLGKMTNNKAEYNAMVNGLEEAAVLGADEVLVIGDSELIIKQMNGVYRVKSADLKPLHEQAKALTRQFSKVTFKHQRREHNSEADRLANLAMDKRADVVFDANDPAASSVSPPAAPSTLEGASSGYWICPDCGCRIKVVRKTRLQPDQLEAFMCCCGMPMREE